MFENSMVSGYEFDEPDYSGNPCCEICGEVIEQNSAVYIPKFGFICDGCIEDCREELGNE